MISSSIVQSPAPSRNPLPPIHLPLTGALAAVSVLLPAAPVPARAAELDLATLGGTNGFRLSAIDIGDFLGSDVSTAGDINGDGIDDLLIGAALADPNGGASGAAYVLFGKTSAFSAVIPVSTLTGTNGFQIHGQDAGDRSGSSVSPAGDINGDGLDDLLIGAPNFDPAFTGAAYVVFGKATPFPATVQLATLGGTNGFQMVGEGVFDFSGTSVSAAGDFNGDGLDDLLVGAIGLAGSEAGAAFVVFGQTNPFAAVLPLSTLDGTNGFQIEGEALSNLGQSVSAAGDFNGDGLDDIVLGAPAAPNGTFTGASYVLFGKLTNFASTLALSNLANSDGFRIGGELPQDRAGYSASDAGDVNGDGFDDILIGAPNSTNASASYLVFGRATGLGSSLDLATLNGSNGFKIHGEALGDQLGYSVSGAGDFNGDGYDDLLIGAPYADLGTNTLAGAVYLLFGRPGGFPAALELTNLDPASGCRIDGESPNYASGNSVHGAGDINGDGFDDILIGSPRFPAVSSGAGHLIFGRNTPPRINQAPGPLSVLVLEDTSLTVPPLLSATDDGPVLTWTNTPASHGTAQVAGIGPSPATFTYVPDSDYFGSDTFLITVFDGRTTASIPVAVTVAPVNDPPTFTPGLDLVGLPGSGPRTVTNWATAISAGPTNELGQTLTFRFTANSNPALFSFGPQVDPVTGDLTYAPAASAAGTAQLTLVLSDDGGPNSNSAPAPFSITVQPAGTATAGSSTAAGSTTSAGTTSAGSPTAGGNTGTGQTCTNAVPDNGWQIALKRPKDPKGKGVKFAPGKRGLGTVKGTVSETGLEKKSTAVQVEIALLTSNHLAAIATNPCALISWSPADRVGKVNKKGASKFASPRFASDANLASGQTFEIWLRAATNFSTSSSLIDRNPIRVR